MDQRFYDAVEASPVIAAIKDCNGMNEVLEMEDIKVVFVIYGDLCSLPDITKALKDAGKIVLIHMDLVQGLSQKEISVDYIDKFCHADGIITTKHSLVRRAKELGMYSVLRFFVIDSIAFENIKQVDQFPNSMKPDFIEILPGVMPKVIERITQQTKIPLIAGGLIRDREDVMGALSAGAMSVSSSNKEVWML